MSKPGASHVDALDAYLVGLVAFVTMIGLTGRPGWRNALGLAVGVYAIVQLAVLNITGLSILTTLLAGRAIGLAVRYGAGVDVAAPARARDRHRAVLRGRDGGRDPAGGPAQRRRWPGQGTTT